MNLIGGKAKVVISDASPSLCGIKNIDQLRSIDLTNTVIGIADNILEPKGNLVMKVFQGPEYKDMLTRLKKKYRQVKTTKPPSSRKKSSEMYVVGLDFNCLHSSKPSIIGIMISVSITEILSRKAISKAPFPSFAAITENFEDKISVK